MFSISFDENRQNRQLFLDSSMVEHTAVNRGVVGSSPTRGVAVRLQSKHAAAKNCPKEVLSITVGDKSQPT